MSKKAVLVVSFGTSVEIAMKAIDHIEQIIQKRFEDHDVFRAFTSSMIIKKLARTKNIMVNSPDKMMEQLAEEGYEELIIQPTHIIPGLEFEKMLAMAAPYKWRFSQVRIGRPLLTTEEDYQKVAHILMKELPQDLADDEAFLLMGHGTTHYVDSTYTMMEHVLRDLAYDHVYVGTVEGFPDIAYIVRRLRRRQVRKVYLMPLLVVAGDHARNDMAGDGEDSWKSILEREGYEVEVILKGLGEIDAVAEVFADHCGQAN